MCGLNGIFAYNVAAGSPDRRELMATRDHMAARGPDGAGEWWSSDRRLGLGHRRLSIIDLSDRAAQPMISACGRYVVVFNGEIYNYPDLRRELEAQGRVFRTTSDTEALLHLYARDGRQMTIHLRGMFAFAIWDNEARSIFLARDPYGIKPLYYHDDGWTVRFASQVKSLIAGGKISRDPEPAGIVGFHLWGSVPEPFTIYQSIRALPAGHTMLVDEAGARRSQAYASIAKAFADGAAQNLPETELVDRVRTATAESVAAHLLADVEVGVFLSAGVDSGALLGLMRDAGQQRIRAITLAFDEFLGTPEDEAPLAAKIAEQYGANHVVRRVDKDEYRSDLPAILAAMDQPSIDGVNTWFVAKAAREAGLKVALSGLGGDELLAGYPSFREIPQWTSLLRLPSAVPGMGMVFRTLVSLSGAPRHNPKLAGLVTYSGSVERAYFLKRALLLPFELETVLDPDIVRRGLKRLNLFGRIREVAAPRSAPTQARIAALESTQYMRNQLLRDADWAGMAHSLEIRTPLVDWRLLQALAPVTPRLQAGAGKRALAAAPALVLPPSIVDRSKTGFGVPTGRWAANTSTRRASDKGSASRSWAREVAASQIDRLANAETAASGHSASANLSPGSSKVIVA
jgi:asparagine synthase (glutamine-hydrolysing)